MAIFHQASFEPGPSGPELRTLTDWATTPRENKRKENKSHVLKELYPELYIGLLEVESTVAIEQWKESFVSRHVVHR